MIHNIALQRRFSGEADVMQLPRCYGTSGIVGVDTLTIRIDEN